MGGRESKSKYAILGALTIKPMSGYQIRELIGRTIGHFWNEGYGQIYPTLKALSTAGLVSARVEPGNGKPDSHVYSLAPSGWEELRQWLARPVDSHQPGRSELLLKLFFGRHAAAGANIDHLRSYRELLGEQITRYEAIEAELNGEDDPDQPYWLMTLRHGLCVTRATHAWCEETIDRLAQLDEEQS